MGVNMKTQSKSHSIPPTIQAIATNFRITGWISLCIQALIVIISGVALLFAISGRNFSDAGYAGTGIGIFWAVCGTITLCIGVYLAFRYTRIAKGLLAPNPDLHPKKADTVKLLRVGVIVGLVGMLLTILGAGATLGLLVQKSIALPQGGAVYNYDPTKLIRAFDIFVEMANVIGISAHFVGTVASLWLLDRVHNHNSHNGHHSS